MAKANSDEFNIGSVAMRVVFSLAIVFLTFNPTGYSYYHWLQQNLTPIQPAVVIAGIVLVGAWLFFIRSTFSSMGTVGVVLLLLCCTSLAVAQKPAVQQAGGSAQLVLGAQDVITASDAGGGYMSTRDIVIVVVILFGIMLTRREIMESERP